MVLYHGLNPFSAQETWLLLQALFQGVFSENEFKQKNILVTRLFIESRQNQHHSEAMTTLQDAKFVIMSFVKKPLENLGKQRYGFSRLAGTGAATVVGWG